MAVIITDKGSESRPLGDKPKKEVKKPAKDKE